MLSILYYFWYLYNTLFSLANDIFTSNQAGLVLTEVLALENQVCYHLCLDFELADRNCEIFLKIGLVVSCFIRIDSRYTDSFWSVLHRFVKLLPQVRRKGWILTNMLNSTAYLICLTTQEPDIHSGCRGFYI